LCEDAIKATESADAIILITEWPEFRLPDWETIIENMKEHVIFDGRNIYNPEEMKEKGFVYYGIGIR
jgi:UDPglucose 6-dehydrogenase